MCTDPFVFGQIAANHALGDCFAMGACSACCACWFSGWQAWSGLLFFPNLCCWLPEGVNACLCYHAHTSTPASAAALPPTNAPRSPAPPPAPAGATPTAALATAVVPLAGPALMEEDLHQMMAGALRTLRAARCALVGGHSSEGAEMALGFSVYGSAPRGDILPKGGLRQGQALILTKPIGTGEACSQLADGWRGNEQRRSAAIA